MAILKREGAESSLKVLVSTHERSYSVMNRPIRVLLILVLSSAALVYGQSPARPSKPASSDHAAAYYNFAMGHLYSELAAAYGNRSDYFTKAIDHFRQALKADPSAGFLLEEITDLYIQAGKIRDAVNEAEEALKQEPENLDSRRVLGRIYARLIGDPQQNKINEEMLKRSIEQYQKITEKAPQDLESWLSLARLERVARNSVEAEKAYKKALGLDANNEEALTGLAMVYADVGDARSAIEMLKRVADQNPRSRVLVSLAGFYEQVKDYNSASDAWKRALELSPDNRQIERAMAQTLFFADRLDEALTVYVRLAASDPEDGQVQVRLAEIYRQKRDFEKASVAMAKAKQLDSNSLEVRYVEINLLESQGKADEAVKILKGVLESTRKKEYTAAEKSNRLMFIERLGFLHRSAQQFPQAVEVFRQMAELDPDSAPRSAVHIIETYRMAKDFAKVREEANAAKAKYPKERGVVLTYASALADDGKAEQAITEVRSLLNGETDRETYLALAQVCEKGKKYDQMRQALDSAEKLSKTEEEKESIYFMRGAMFEKLKQFEAAEAEFRRVLKASPDSAAALNYLGYMLADRGVRLEEALKMISRAVELDSQNGAYLDSLGWVYFKMGKFEEAETYLRRALEKVPGDPTVHDHLGDAFYRQGKLKEAIAQWQRSVKEWETSSRAEADHAEMAKINKKLESAKVRLAKEGSSATAIKQR